MNFGDFVFLAVAAIGFCLVYVYAGIVVGYNACRRWPGVNGYLQGNMFASALFIYLWPLCLLLDMLAMGVAVVYRRFSHEH